MSFLTNLKKETNVTQTWNGAKAFKSTESKVLDLFAIGGNARTMTEDELYKLISNAMYENPEIGIRVAFYLSDVRGGQKSRDMMRATIKFLVFRYLEQARKLIALIPEYSRWDMLYEFVGTPLEKDAFAVLKAEVKDAIRTKRNSLVFKWLKSVNTSSEESNRLGRLTAKYFGMNEKDYRKMLSHYRKELNVVEVNMSADQWDLIDYSKLPSRAGFIYREAFKRHDLEGYTEFLQTIIKESEKPIEERTVKMNMDLTFPHEIINAYRSKGVRNYWGRSVSKNDYDVSLEAMWKSLPDYTQGKEGTMAVVDVSGSMYQSLGKTNAEVIDMSIGMGIYLAERLKGAFANHIITFDSNPKLIELPSRMTLAEKINRCFEDSGTSTDIDKVFGLILRTAIRNSVPQSEMPKTILIVSDMQFNAGQCRNTTNYDSWVTQFERAGYVLPEIVYWNAAAAGNVPVTESQRNTSIISGASPEIIRWIYTGEFLTPYEQMMRVIERERYDAVAEIFKGV